MNVSFVMGHERGTCCRCLGAREHGASSTEKQINGEYRENIPCQLAHIARKKAADKMSHSTLLTRIRGTRVPCAGP